MKRVAKSACVGLVLMGTAALGQVPTVPARTEQNVIVAAYNIQWLGERAHDLGKLATVIQHFDVCGIVEVKVEKSVSELVGELEELTDKDWGYAFGVRTHRPGGRYHEAYAVVWRRDRVQLGDGVISGFWDLEESFRNDPYISSFKRNNFDFALVLIHTRWTDDEEGTREGEVAMMAEQLNWMRPFLNEDDLIVAGDFNYKGTAAPMTEMAENAGLVQLDTDPKSTFKSNNTGYANSYDHMYVLESETQEYVDGSCSTLDATRLVYSSNSPSNMGKSKKELSDHLPVFAVFKTDGPDDD